jgi:hypothetical protein
VNSFAAHLLLPVKAVRTTMAWLGASAQDCEENTARAQVALGYLMLRYGVSMPCALGQLVDAGYLTVSRKNELAAQLQAGSVTRAAEHLIAGRPRPETTLSEQRPPARLATFVVEAARSGAVGMHTVAAILGRPDDEQLFDEVMFGAPTPAMA